MAARARGVRDVVAGAEGWSYGDDEKEEGYAHDLKE